MADIVKLDADLKLGMPSSRPFLQELAGVESETCGVVALLLKAVVLDFSYEGFDSGV